MAKSNREFNRWKAHDESTWAFQVYRKYNRELFGLIEAYRCSSAYTYSQLKLSGAQLTDAPQKFFSASSAKIENFDAILDWSDSLGSFDNWVNLSNVTTIASNLETYLASVVALALDSDPSVLIGAPVKSIDGAYVLKYRTSSHALLRDRVTECTKGDWSARLAAIERLFGQIPNSMRKHHSHLEQIRNIRNRFGHAFGRDIEVSRKHGNIEIAPMEKVTRSTVENLGRSAWKFVQATDEFLLENHIGDFEAVNFYANIYPSQLSHVAAGQRAVNLKKAIGKFGAGLRGKIYCNGLVDYWEAL